MNLEEAKAKLELLGQSSILKYWDNLASDERDFLLSQIDSLNVETFFKQQELLSHPLSKQKSSIEPFTHFHGAGNAADEMLGKEAIAQGKMGCLIVAGGQGTRLHLNGPKGMYPISTVKKKSLFQLFSEKVLAAGKQSHQKLKVAIMTSPLNHAMTHTYFQSHALFGLNESQISFFSQKTLPFLDDQGNLFLEKIETIAQGPDGNGSSLINFWESGIGPAWKAAGIEYVNFIMIDNLLADPFDAELLGFHIRNQNDITVKCTLKASPDEKVGVLTVQDGKVHVVEYSEMAENERQARLSDGLLKYACANISLFCINLSFIEKLHKERADLSLHAARKAATQLNQTDSMAWKFEYFIFDCLPLASKVQALLYPREDCFAPLKNFNGDDSPETVQTALQNKDRQIYEKIFGKTAPLGKFELSQDFYYPLPAYIDKWKYQDFSNDGYLGEA